MSRHGRFRFGFVAALSVIALSLTGVIITPSFREAHAGNSANSPARTSGGGASTDAWLAGVLATVQAKVPSLTSVAFRSPCTTKSLEAESAVVGSGAVNTLNTSTGANGGVLQLTSTTSSSSQATVRNKDSKASAGSTSTFVMNMRTQKWAVAAHIKIISGPAGTLLELISMTDDATSDTYVGVEGSLSTTHYMVKIGSASHVDLGVAFDAGFHTIVMVADGTNITVLLDGVQMGAVQAQSTVGTTAGHFASLAANFGTASNAEHWLDDIAVITETAN